MPGVRDVPLSRRAVIGVGAVAAAAGVAACASPGTPGTTPSSTPPPTPPSMTPAAVNRWKQFAGSVRGRLLRPGDSAWGVARLTENPRFDGARPLGVLLAASGHDIARAFAFAQDNDIAVQLRSGGHSYAGWSSGGGGDTGQPAALVIDCGAMNAVSLDRATATVGAGASLATVYQSIGSKGRAIPGGSCATVGIAGLSQGGGVGVLTRAFGLTCDAVTSMQVVLADGSSVTASADDHDDLFWALRGGGGGHLGMVTSFDFATVAAPDVNTFYLQWPASAAAEVIAAWQDWIDGADPRLWSTLKVLGASRHPTGAIVACAGTWIGPGPALPKRLAELLRSCPAPTSKVTHRRDYLDAMLSYAGCSTLPASRCHTGPGGGLQREAFAATSHVGYESLTGKGIATLIDHVRAAPSSLVEAGLSMDALGGKVADVAPHETAFVHRAARITVQYTATYTGNRGSAAWSFVHDFRNAMTPSWGNHAYVNYADPTLKDYRSAYFGDNVPRLATIRQTYDPHGFFTQPQDF